MTRSIFHSDSETGGFLSPLQAGTGGLSHTQKSQTGWSLSYTDDLSHRLGVFIVWSFSQTGGLSHRLVVFVIH